MLLHFAGGREKGEGNILLRDWGRQEWKYLLFLEETLGRGGGYHPYFVFCGQVAPPQNPNERGPRESDLKGVHFKALSAQAAAVAAAADLTIVCGLVAGHGLAIIHPQFHAPVDNFALTKVNQGGMNGDFLPLYPGLGRHALGLFQGQYTFLFTIFSNKPNFRRGNILVETALFVVCD